MEKTYICAEPEELTAYKDNTGKLHNTRDQAIAASFDTDFHRAVHRLIERDPKLHGTPMTSLRILVREFIQKNPDMARVLAGDRDAT
jgi:hypothetical protein